MTKKLNHIELFAGCGGMSLGLKAAGFDLFMANELSPMASETYAYNLLGEDLQQLAEAKNVSSKVIWLQSQYDKNDLKLRLRENPFQFNQGNISDLNDKTELEGKLLVGNINSFLNFLENNQPITDELKDKSIDLLSGGPPCQGFSMAGKRIKDDYKNLLPLSFAKLAGLIKPKVILLENVKGITAPFTVEDIKYYAWLEVSKAFSLFGYVPVCMLLNSKYFGIPQNRPRFILMGFRKDICDQIFKEYKSSSIAHDIIENSLNFYMKVLDNKDSLENITPIDLKLYDIEKDNKYFNGEILPKIVTPASHFVSAKDAIDDIKSSNDSYTMGDLNNEYVLKLNLLFKPLFDNEKSVLENHEFRKHKFDVKARFRLYQVLRNLNGSYPKATDVVLGKNTDEKTVREVFGLLSNEELLFIDGYRKIKDYQEFKQYIQNFKSKKQTQRALKESDPAPAQLTIPDDLCHYSSSELRTLTVREMARFQSFPDWYVFRSKITTGGKQRAYEVPQYTQIGNAVPPLLAFELGNIIKQIVKTVYNV